MSIEWVAQLQKLATHFCENFEKIDMVRVENIGTLANFLLVEFSFSREGLKLIGNRSGSDRHLANE